jgi:simple sugar transport system permease protein
LRYGPWKDPHASGFPRISPFADTAVLPQLFGVHIGWIVTLVLVVLVYILMKDSKLGYEIAVIGESEATARYAGINVAKTVIVTMLISGGLCGLAGMMQASGIEKSLSEQLSGGLGFTAIITTWLSRLNPPMTLVVSLLFAVLLQGGSYIQSSLQIPAAVSDILQGSILFFVLGSEFFTQYRVVMDFSRAARKKPDHKEEA